MTSFTEMSWKICLIRMVDYYQFPIGAAPVSMNFSIFINPALIFSSPEYVVSLYIHVLVNNGNEV